MSYDFFIATEELNYTSNVAPMFNACIKEGIKTIHGSHGLVALIKLRAIRRGMEDQYPAILLLEPPNGWGTYDGAHELINKLIRLTIKHPDDEWSVCS